MEKETYHLRNITYSIRVDSCNSCSLKITNSHSLSDRSCYPFYFLYSLKNLSTIACCLCWLMSHSLYSCRSRWKCSAFSWPSMASHIRSAICGGKLFLMSDFCISLEILLPSILYKSCIVIMNPN